MTHLPNTGWKILGPHPPLLSPYSVMVILILSTGSCTFISHLHLLFRPIWATSIVNHMLAISMCWSLIYLRCPQYYLDLLSGPSTFPLSWSCKSVPHSPPFFQQVLPILSPNICWLNFFLRLHFMTFVQVSNFFHLQPPLLSLLLLYDSFSTLQNFFFLNM